jgi:hypothetical protein
LVLSAKILKNVDSLNAWQYADHWSVGRDGNLGEPATLYFQIVDTDRDSIRYMPSALATMTVTFPSLDDDLILTKTATLAFADDRSIWKVDLLASELPNGGIVRFSITDGGITRRWSVQNALRINKVNAGGC